MKPVPVRVKRMGIQEYIAVSEISRQKIAKGRSWWKRTETVNCKLCVCV
jgi:hypothetical protein